MNQQAPVGLLTAWRHPSFVFSEVAEVGVEPTKSRGSRPRRFASLRTRPSSSRSGSRTRQAELMRLGWALAHLRHSLHVLSDQGETRTPTPRRARRSERRVFTSYTTWPCIHDPCGNRTRLCGLRGRRPTDRRTGRVGREGIEPLVVHLTCFVTTALQAAVRSTTQWHRRESNPHSRRFELRRFAGLRTVPQRFTSQRPRRDLNP
jgi:hypothetical protein